MLAHPVNRSQLLLQRAATIAAGAAVIATAIFFAIRATARLSTISAVDFAARGLNAALLGVLFGALAPAVGATIGRRSMALGVAAVVGVLTYAANTVAPRAGASWTRVFPPFHYYIGAQPLKYGVTWLDAAVLLGAAVALIALATTAFRPATCGCDSRHQHGVSALVTCSMPGSRLVTIRQACGVAAVYVATGPTALSA